MARRKIHTIRVGAKCSVGVYRDSELDEFIVRSVVNGRTVGGKDGGYFTDDKEDAFDTAKAEAAHLRTRPMCRK
jgi:hypothetical protein